MKLTEDNLHQLPDTILKPQYDRSLTNAGIVHLGIGVFHRAHQAVYTENVLNSFGGNWKIIGVSLKTPNIRDCMRPQNELYTVVEKGLSKARYQVIGSIHKILYAAEDTKTILSAMSHDDCKIISLTITEKGYCRDPVSGRLNIDHPDIAHDIRNILEPRSAIGFLVSSLQRRKNQNVCIPTIVCCDNLPQNGDNLRKQVLEFANWINSDLQEWITETVSFPNTMVDRIVPAVSSNDIEELNREQGYLDNAVVSTEFFSQWVIEDRFTSGRPAWEKVGALLVKNVNPYEEAKLRLLNGCHSAIAYLGYLAGHQYVHQVMQQHEFRAFIHYLMHEEIRPTVRPPPNLNLDQYCDELLERFTNPTLNHHTYQIAMDGSQKLPQRLLSVIHDQVARHGTIEATSLVIAAWIRYACGVDEQGNTYVVQDPLAEKLNTIFQEHGLNAEKLATTFLNLREIFGSSTGRNDNERELLKVKVSYWLEQLITPGTAKTIKYFIKNKIE